MSGNEAEKLREMVASLAVAQLEVTNAIAAYVLDGDREKCLSLLFKHSDRAAAVLQDLGWLPPEDPPIVG
ncbi:MAG: hypothetical protein JO264_17055 [Acidisphaera sp.]|nr:hypothetical protein [Acidisphaera sp.]